LREREVCDLIVYIVLIKHHEHKGNISTKKDKKEAQAWPFKKKEHKSWSRNIAS